MKGLNWVLIILCILGLVGVRIMENTLFYDPLLRYFKSSGDGQIFPDIKYVQLIGSHIFRFGLNLILSGLIIHLIFKNKNWTVQALILMILVFLIVFPIYLYCVYSEFSVGKLFSFYMRRFVIQPVTLLIIVPIFYYRRHLEKH